MRKIIIYIFILSCASISLFAQPGTLDPTFGTGGKVVVPQISGYNFSESLAMAIQLDGKIVMTHYAYNTTSGKYSFGVSRLNTDGSVDNSFSGDGHAFAEFLTTQYAQPYGIAIAPDGKIVVTGYYYEYISGNYYYSMPAVRFNTDGSLDNSFDGDGYVFIDQNINSNHLAFGVDVQQDGKILLTGRGINPQTGQYDFKVVRLNTNGALDNSFDGDGRVYIDFSNNYEEAYKIRVQPDGKIVVSGSAYNPNNNNNYDFAVARLNTDGSLDNGFGTGGKAVVDVGGYYDYAWGLDFQSNGKIVVSGYIYYNNSSNNYDYGVIRLNTNGSLDNSFDSEGKKTVDFSVNQDIGWSVAVQNDGRILLNGYVYNGSTYDFGILRLNEDGSFDNSFDGDGKLLLDFANNSYDLGRDIALQQDGKIVVSGYSSGSFGYGPAAARLLNDVLTYTLSCPGNQNVNATAGQCSAIVNNIDPVLSPTGSFSLVNYVLSGATTGSGSGSVSGMSFNKGVTTVTYTLANDASETCNFTVAVNGIAAGALNFDGVNDYVNIPALNLNSNHVTIEAWIKPNGYQGDFDGIVFSRAGNSVAGIGIKSNNELEYHWNDDGLTYAWPSGAIVTPNQWSHIALVIEPTKATIYLNGIAYVNNVNHSIEEFNGITRIGKDDPYSTQDRHFNGNIDEVRIWNRSLSQAEIQHNANCELTLPQTALIAYYKFSHGFSTCDNTGITSLTDASGNNYTGTLFNFALVGSQSNWVLGNIVGNCTPFDQNPPNLTCPENIVASTASGQCTAIVNFEATASDPSGVGSITYSKNPGTVFQKGLTTVTVTATDGLGNAATCSFTVTVNDNEKPTITCPGNQNVNLNATCQLVAPDLITGLTGSDNCGTVTFTQSPLAGASLASSHNQTHNIVITASDGNGNAQTCTVVLTGKDVTKPTFTCPDNQNVNLNATCQLLVPNLIGELTGSDNCGTVTFTQNPIAGASLASSHNQTHNIMVTASDGNGNTQTCTVTLTGKDVTKPTFICPDNQNINLSATCQLLVPNLIAELAGSDNCGTVTFIQSPVVGASLGSSHNQTHNVLITANDGNGNTQTCTVVLTGKDVTKPTFTCPGNQNVNLNATCQLLVPNLIAELTGSDNCGTVTFTQSPLAGASLGSSHNQTHNVVITASDGNGNTQTCTVVLTGKDVAKPTFVCPDNQNVNLNGTCQLIIPNLIAELAGSDNCGIVTFTQSPIAGASLTSSHDQTHNVLITANDGNGNTQTCTVVLTGKDATKPTFTCPGNQNINLNATCQLLVPNLIAGLTGSDNCGIVTFTQSPVAGSSLGSSHDQTHNVLITASDGNGNTQTCTVVLTGKDVTKPTFVCPYNQNVNLNGTCQLLVPNLIAGLTGSDNCGTVTFTQSPVAGASLGSSHNQTHNVLITASDGNGNTQTCTVVLTGKDVAKPTFTCPYDRNVNLNASCQLIVPNLIAGLTGYDNCGIVTFSQNPVAGSSFASPHNQTHNVVITASDGNGNTQSCTVVLTAKDVTLPVITCPSPKTISCDASILPANTGSATASDNCGGNPVITYSDVSGQDPNPPHAGYYNYTITRTWMATDVATNTSTCNQTITVQDITKPTINCPADKLSIPFDFGQLYATIVIGNATATDNCAANPNITIAGTRSDNVVISNQQYPSGTTTVSWSATDPASNSSACTQTITVRKRNTAVTYTGDMIDNKICVQYSDIINLQAKLTDNEGLVTSNNISGRTITFQLLRGTTVLRTKSATTNASEIAVDTFKIEQAPGMYIVKTIFAGDDYFNGSGDQDNCEVKQEDAIVEYNGSQYFTTSSSTTMAGSVTLAASLNDIDDGSDKRGDIRKAKATFRDGGPAGTVLGSANLPVGLVNPGILTNGLSATTKNYTLTTGDAGNGGKIFQVWVGASDHYTGADAGPTPVTLALPGQDFVTGGGHLVVTNSAGTYAGTVNSKMNFGFTMKWNKSGKSIQGQINIVFRKWQLYNGLWQWRIYQMKSNAINSMAVVEVGSNGLPVTATNPAVFRKAIVNTKANLKDVTDPLNNVDLGGNHNLVLDAWDHITTNGGVSDKISVMLMGATTNELLFSSNWVANATQAKTITGGNINVRNGSGGSVTTINSITKAKQMESLPMKEDPFTVRAYPNPSEHQFTLIVNSNLKEMILIQLYDAAGRKIEVLRANASETIRFGAKLKAGIYIAHVTQGDKQESIKLIKQ